MSKNVVTPKSVSFEDALRNLAGRLTGRPAAELPRTQEGIVQFMAENVPTLDELVEAVTRKVAAQLAAAAPPADEGETEDTNKAPRKAHDAPDTSGGTSVPMAADKPRCGAKAKTAK